MHYYEVYVSSQKYHGSDPLTYSSADQLQPGSIVEVALGAQSVIGMVVREVKKPDFSTKPIKRLITDKPIPATLQKLHAWMLEYYPGPSGITTQLFLPASLATSSRRKTKSSSSKPSEKLPPLTTDQQNAISVIENGAGSFLLHGDTASGKTRVYIELIQRTLSSNKSAIVLTPEIGLTPQLVATLEEVFPNKVMVVHSTQTTAERRDNWKAIHEHTEPIIVVGPRSAIFSPLDDLGIVIIDEAHDTAYKQDQMPYYQTSRVAATLAHLHSARLVLGSATPLIHDYFIFSTKGLPIIRMREAATGKRDVTTEIIDLNDRQQFSKSPWLSDQLISSIQSALHNGYQSLIFLNRRGTARLVVCENCSWQAVCPRCDLPFTYHGDTHQLQCHTCGLTDKTPLTCPDCKQPEVKFKSVGTKAIVTEALKLFPEASVQRFDSDTKKSESLETHFSQIAEGKVDILVGTQILSKGLDLPLLQVIGVVAADTSMYFPDYTAEERTFQMIHQVIGRVGRGHIPGKVVIQSYQPKSTALQAAISGDYEQLYTSQLQERKQYHFPPFFFVLKISIDRATQATARVAAHNLAEQVLKAGFAIELSGPSPSFIEKSRNRYRWQIIIKSKQRSELVQIIKLLPKNCSYDIDPTNLL